jgi:hypothetical protein
VRLAIAAAVLALASNAVADDIKLEPQSMRFVETDTQLTVSLLPPPHGGIGSIFDQRHFDELRSGTPTQVVIHMQITPQGSDEAVAQQTLTREVRYDPWKDKYFVTLEEPTGKRTFSVKPQSEALKWMTAVDDVPVATLRVLPTGKVFELKMVVELNPHDQAALARVRRSLAQGAGGGIERGGGLFGSFTQLFLHPNIEDADRILRVQSKPFYRPAP